MSNQRIENFLIAVAISQFLFSSSLHSQTASVWTSVTPSNVNLSLDYGTENIGVDPNKPSDLYVEFMQEGIWKSTDYGQTWNGPINTGTNGSAMQGSGGVVVANGGAGNPPILYEGNIRDPGTGFWRSLDGGVSWTNYNIAPAGGRQDVYPPAVDPYDPQHVLVAAHEYDGLYESTDGGQTWSNVSLNSGMLENGGTGAIFFINTGNAATTRKTFLWMAQQSGGVYGTWRTADDGANWTKVDNNEHPHGASELYQPGNGVVYMAGAYSALGWGVLRSTDYGQTWAHVGLGQETGVFGTPSHVYAMYGGPAGNGANVDPSFELAPQPGLTGWVAQSTPSAMHNEGFANAAVTYDGSQYVLVVCCWNAGLWRYVESSPTSKAANQSASVAKLGTMKVNSVRLTKTGVAVRSADNKFYDVKGRAMDDIEYRLAKVN